MKIKIINAPSDLGVSIDGTSLGPNIIKNEIINNKTIDIIDTYCDCSRKSYDKLDLKKNLSLLNNYNEKLYSTLLEEKDANTITITLGGDHSIAIASALASIKYEKSLGIIWIDAHTDFNTFETTITGNIHGMPLATLTENNGHTLTSFHKEKFFKNENTIIIGSRDIDPLEQENLNKANIKVYSTKDVINTSINEIVDNSIMQALENTNGIHVSIDIDILDPDEAPGVSVKVKNGITKNHFFQILDNFLIYKDKIKSFDIVEYNPLNDKEDKTKKIVLEVIDRIINNYK